MRKLSEAQIENGRWIAVIGYSATVPSRTAAAMAKAGYIVDSKTSDSGPVWRFTPEGLYAWAKQAPAWTMQNISRSYIEDAEREAHLEDHRRTAARLCSDTNELVTQIEQRHPELTRDQAERLAKSGDAVSVVCMACGDSFATLDESSQHDHIRQAEELADDEQPTSIRFEINLPGLNAALVRAGRAPMTAADVERAGMNVMSDDELAAIMNDEQPAPDAHLASHEGESVYVMRPDEPAIRGKVVARSDSGRTLMVAWGEAAELANHYAIQDAEYVEPAELVRWAEQPAPYLNDFEGDDAECDEPADDDLERKLAERRAAGGATFEQRTEIVRLAASRNVPAALEPVVTAATAVDGVLAYDDALDAIGRLLRAPGQVHIGNKIDAYKRQTGRPILTPKQARRLNKKLRRDLVHPR